jgi:site-specific recombinase XerD
MKVADRMLFERIRDYLSVYLPKVRARSEGTVKAYRGIINNFLGYLTDANGVALAGIRTAMITAESLRGYLEWLVDVKGCAPATRNLRLSCIRSFCSYLASEDITFMAEYSRMKQLAKLPSDSDSRFVWLTLEQVKLILSLPNPHTRHGLRDLAYLTLLYDSGMRNGEMLGVRLEDIRMDGGCSIRVVGKGRKIRVVPISNEASEVLSYYLDRFHADSERTRWLFYTLRRGVKNAMSSDNAARIMEKYERIAKTHCADIPHLHPHLWRHSRSMHLYKAGMPLPLLSEWLGHSQMETSLIYAHADTEMKRKAIETAMGGEEPVTKPEKPVYDEEEMLRRIYALS